MFERIEANRASAANLSEMPLEGLEQEITELAAHIYAGSCRWLELVAEFDRREAHVKWGFHSCSRWLAWTCGLTPRAAREHVRVARALSELIEIRTAFACGEVSYSKVRALTRVAAPETEADLLELARHASAAQLERVVCAYRTALAVEGAQPPHTYIAWSWEEDGTLSIRGKLPADQGALFLRALDAGRDLVNEGGSAVPPQPQRHRPFSNKASNVEAFATVTEGFLTQGPVSSSSGERYQVVLHVDASELERSGARSERDRCELERGPALSSETARRLACDATVVSLFEADGKPLSVGRKTRTIPPALRRALASRDHGCRFPDCSNHRFVDAHHIRHWARGGETALDNLVQLCRRHHRLVHEGGFSVERRPDGELCFRQPNGAEIPEVPVSPTGDRAWVGSLAAGRLLPSSGDRLDLDLAVSGLLCLSDPRGG